MDKKIPGRYLRHAPVFFLQATIVTYWDSLDYYLV